MFRLLINSKEGTNPERSSRKELEGYIFWAVSLSLWVTASSELHVKVVQKVSSCVALFVIVISRPCLLLSLSIEQCCCIDSSSFQKNNTPKEELQCCP